MKITSLTAYKVRVPTKGDYNEVSKEFWSAVHETLSGTGSAEKNLAVLEKKLKRLRGRGW